MSPSKGLGIVPRPLRFSPLPGAEPPERCRYRISSRTGGHAELYDDWGKSYCYLTDATGKRTHTYAYGPTGLPRGTTAEAVPQSYRYAGAYADPTGLYKMGHRYYDPTLGRFTQPDPSGQEENAHLYAGGDPINRVDPSGLDFLGWDGGQWASAAGVGASVAGAFASGPLGIGLAAASVGLGLTGSIMQGNSVGQTVATGILGAATGGVGVLAASAGIGGKTGIGLAAGYTALDVEGGGIGISGSFP
ncbi:RHS repeat-associated core domain-containing protein [Streptomyces sp. NPDC059459]|uniref:RHS repeat-associated core domain-containing protein n=1 Tax=Streptomyces sp. NPDC059459 TaxID=3346839 RepID=UPI003687DFE8